MKEAAGEANLTVVAIILIAVVVAVATPLVTSLMSSSTYRSCCTDAGGVWKNGQSRRASGVTTTEGSYQKSQYLSCQQAAGVSSTRAWAN